MRIPGLLRFWDSRIPRLFQDFRIIGFQDSRILGFQDLGIWGFRDSELLGLRGGIPSFQHSAFPRSWDFQDSEILGFQECGSLEFQDSRISGNSRILGNMDFGISIPRLADFGMLAMASRAPSMTCVQGTLYKHSVVFEKYEFTYASSIHNS